MQTTSIDLSQAFSATSEVIARRNQDGTVILMRLDETSLFYKIDGIAAAVWAEFEKPKTAKGLIAHFSGLYPEKRAELETEIPAFLQELMNRKLLVQASDAADAAFRTAGPAQTGGYRFGSIKEFNLEQIETEVLNESIYLDVFAGSDLRLKKDVTPIQNALSKVVQLEGIRYHWDSEKAADASTAPQAGLIAQQVALHMPELVRADQKTGYLAVEYSKLASYLVEAIKDLNHLVLAQEEKIQKLEKALNERTPPLS